MNSDQEERETSTNELEPPSTGVSKATLLRDITVFQIKLFVDGMRDLVLIPVSFFAGLVSLIRAGDEAGSEFYEVVSFGRKTERSINLFEAADRLRPPDQDKIGLHGDSSGTDLDGLLNEVESYVRDQVDQGRLEAVKQNLQGLMSSRDGRGRTRKPNPSDDELSNADDHR